MLHHVQDMSIPCTPAKDELHNDERKPVCLVPKTKEVDQADTDGGESQLHLEAAVHGPANACGDLIAYSQGE